jgi:hypothetical protein
LDEDDSLYEVDIVCLVGTLTKEQKAHHIRTFVQGSSDSFNPQLLVATSGAANAGLDDPNVCGVFRLDFPASIVDWAQEKGRAGRYEGATVDDCFYYVAISLESFLYLFQQCQDPSVSTEYQAAQLNDLFQVLRLLVLPERCFQVVLESVLSHPDDATIPDDPCGCCSFCKDSSAFPAVDRTGVVHVLFNLFLHGDDRITGTTTVDKVIRAMVDFEDIAMHLFRSSHTLAKPPVTIKKLLLTLIAAEIITLQFQKAASGSSEPSEILLGLQVFSLGATTFAMDFDAF